MSTASYMSEGRLPTPRCFAELCQMAFDGKDLTPLRDQIRAQTHSNSVDSAAALISLCSIEQLLGNQAAGLAYQAQALDLHPLYASSWPTSSHPLRALAFRAAGDISTNTPIEFLLEVSDVLLYSLYVMPGKPIPQIPDHDVAIVTVGESDRDLPVMREIEKLIETWRTPVLNRPDRVLQLSREGMYALLRGLPGVAMPATVRIGRAEFEKLGHSSLPGEQFEGEPTFPMIARPIGSHAGRGLEKIATPEAIAAYLLEQPENEFFLSPYMDYSSSDGQFRKYRVIWVDGRPYPCHMAIAGQWKVWYYNAGMATDSVKRAEEEQFMSGFDEGFARRHSTALATIATRIDLEYMGVDCAELPDGRLLVFEGDVSLVVHDMDPPELYPYKSAPTQRLFAAFYKMLRDKSR